MNAIENREMERREGDNNCMILPSLRDTSTLLFSAAEQLRQLREERARQKFLLHRTPYTVAEEGHDEKACIRDPCHSLQNRECEALDLYSCLMAAKISCRDVYCFCAWSLDVDCPLLSHGTVLRSLLVLLVRARGGYSELSA
jgi:hypothetical protein